MQLYFAQVSQRVRVVPEGSGGRSSGQAAENEHSEEEEEEEAQQEVNKKQEDGLPKHLRVQYKIKSKTIVVCTLFLLNLSLFSQ